MDRSIYLVLFMLSTVLCSFTFKSEKGISDGVSNGRKGERVVISWILGPMGIFNQLEIRNKKGELIAEDSDGNIVIIKKTVGTDRISALNVNKNSNNKEWGLIFNKLKYEDGQKFEIEVSYTFVVSVNVTGVKHIQQTLQLNVKGGPELCNISNTNIIKTTKLSNQLKFTAEVCGNPKPENVYWLINDKSYPTGAPITRNYTHSYTRVGDLPAEACGKDLTFVAIAEDGLKFTSIYKDLKFDFTPKQVKIIKSSLLANCIMVKWQKLDTGNCDVTYMIRPDVINGSFLSVNKSIAGGVFEHCYSNRLKVKEVHVSIQAVYRTFKGKATSLVVKLGEGPSKVPTKKSNVGLIVAIFIVALLLIIFLLLVFVYLFYARCLKRSKLVCFYEMFIK